MKRILNSKKIIIQYLIDLNKLINIVSTMFASIFGPKQLTPDEERITNSLSYK